MLGLFVSVLPVDTCEQNGCHIPVVSNFFFTRTISMHASENNVTFEQYHMNGKHNRII